MTKAVCGTAVMLAICASVVLVGWPGQDAAVRTERLNPRIGPAKQQRYKSIRDAKDWKNPILVIRRDGIEVIAKGLPSGSRTVPPSDLRQALIELPVTAWPFGRVVAVQEIGLREPDLSDGKAIGDNLDATLAILKTLQVSAERWPSA